MLDLNTVRNRAEWLVERLSVKGFDAKDTIEKILSLDVDHRSTKTSLDEVLSKRNKIAKEIGELFKTGKQDQAQEMKAEAEKLKEESARLEETYNSLAADLNEQLVMLPNVPHESVPTGRNEEDNETVKSSIDAEPAQRGIPHWEIGSKYDIIDMDLGTKITGAGFPVYKGKGARLQRALIAFFLDRAAEAGYTEYLPPLLVNKESAFATGQLPDKEGQMYEIGADGFYLIPTAEVPITNVYRDTILKTSDFPVKMCGFTPCFRREAGSYGKEVRGLNRVHQFDKVEIVQLVHPDNSYKVLDEMVEHVEAIVQDLGLPYRIVRLCGGDISFASALTFDFEVYSVGQGRWLEVSSVSNFETFQANRLKLRYKNEDGKNVMAHTLNGSALALARIMGSLLEFYQDDDGIEIPEILRPYTGFDRID